MKLSAILRYLFNIFINITNQFNKLEFFVNYEKDDPCKTCYIYFIDLQIDKIYIDNIYIH